MAPVLGGVNSYKPGRAEALLELLGGRRDEPVVRVNEVEIHPLAELLPCGRQVTIHVLDPGDERVEVVLREIRLGDAVHEDSMPFLDRRPMATAARQHVHLGALVDEALGKLADMPRQAAFDDRWVLPREDEDTPPHAGRE